MTYQTPCQDPENDPNDWFICRDGKQYSDDDFLTDEVREGILAEANRQGLEGEARVAFIEKAQDGAELDAKRYALRRRRQAKEACFGCYLRTNCLTKGLDGDHRDGTWGGYYEEELRAIRSEIAKKNRSASIVPRPRN